MGLKTRGLLDRACLFLATGAGISYIALPAGGRKWTGAGFLGSLEGLALWWLFPGSAAAAAALLLAAAPAAAFACGRAEELLGFHDDSRIVLDEVVGMWAATVFLPRTPAAGLAALAAFRLFDVLKPPPCRALERLPGGLGVVADDAAAGMMAHALVSALLLAAPSLGGGA